ncbi:hypothetical protein WBJ53_25505 [Spirosoma sp. SC4-14]|uniref:hypothetical protein n=1 Tax=Spirosoma sp. SC4-14 TaxID=3128900 RepID=UPI0030CD6D4B
MENHTIPFCTAGFIGVAFPLASTPLLVPNKWATILQIVHLPNTRQHQAFSLSNYFFLPFIKLITVQYKPAPSSVARRVSKRTNFMYITA